MLPVSQITANQLVGAYEGQQIKLECHSEAYPKSINYWTKEKGDIVPQGELHLLTSCCPLLVVQLSALRLTAQMPVQ